MKNRRFVFRSAVLSLLLAPQLSVTLAATTPQVNGKFEKIGRFRVLRVWGTHEEMGFAHGFLLAKEFVGELDAGFAAQPPETRKEYDQALTALRAAIRVPDKTMAELQGMFRGIGAASGSTPTIEAVRRPLTVDDLVLHNAGDTLRAFGCSGFTVWGEQAGDAGVITARNFDFALLTPKMLDQQLIVVRQPTGGKQVALITWPCFIGAVTGINEDGVCAFMHDGTGERHQAPQGKYTPVALAMTELLEQVGPSDAHATFEKGLRTLAPYPFSYLLRVVTPLEPGSKGPAERAFHIDAAGFGENSSVGSQCITTNHYLDVEMMPPRHADDWTLKRYRKIERGLGKGVTPESAWDTLRDVAAEGNRDGTLYSLVVYPQKRKLELAFARLEGDRLIAAPKNKSASIEFSDLFAKWR